MPWLMLFCTTKRVCQTIQPCKEKPHGKKPWGESKKDMMMNDS